MSLDSTATVMELFESLGVIVRHRRVFTLDDGSMMIDVDKLTQLYLTLSDYERERGIYRYDFSHIPDEHFVNVDPAYALSGRIHTDMPCFATKFKDGIQIFDGWHRMYRLRARGESVIDVFEFPAWVVSDACIGNKPEVVYI